MIIVDSKGIVVGRLASFVAKNALKGEEVAVVNCEEAIMTGNRKRIEEDFREKRGRIGSGQKGPKHHRSDEKIVKRTIRGMLPNHRFGRGRIAFKKIRCYNRIPKELEGEEMVQLSKENKLKANKLKNLRKKHE